MSAKVTCLHGEFENYIFNITATSPSGQWVDDTDMLKNG